MIELPALYEEWSYGLVDWWIDGNNNSIVQ